MDRQNNKQKGIKENNDIIYKLIRGLFKPLFLLLFHPVIENKVAIPIEEAAVIAGNHKHALDPILVDVCTGRVVHTLAKKDLHDGTFGWFFRAIGSIPVDLHAKRNHQALVDAVTCLENGELINVSPEAKRNYTDEILLPFKPGAVVMAKRSGCKVIPYAITGDYKLFGGNLKIRFGEPLDLGELSVEEANRLLFSKVKELLCDTMPGEKHVQRIRKGKMQKI